MRKSVSEKAKSSANQKKLNESKLKKVCAAELLLRAYTMAHEYHATGGVESAGITPSLGATRKPIVMKIAQTVCAANNVLDQIDILALYEQLTRKLQNLRRSFTEKIDEVVAARGGSTWLIGYDPKELSLKLLEDGFLTPTFVRESFQMIDFTTPLTTATCS